MFIVIDGQRREPLGRSGISLGIDMLTRMVAASHPNLNAPSRVSIGLCRLHAAYDKAAWLAERDYGLESGSSPYSRPWG